jgi:SAM-dependent methyltransferase
MSMNPDHHNHPSFSCLICRGEKLQPVPGFESLPRITSDCRPFGAGGKLAVCLDCSLVQKIPDEQWLAEIGAIYKGYAAYSVGGGEEQLVMDPHTGRPRKRSEVLMQELRELAVLPERQRALDVGCGHGVTLRAMAKAFPLWQLFGHELDDAKRAQLEAIEHFERLYTGSLDGIEGRFGFVSMIHSLEHFVEPLATLRSLHDIVEPDGNLFVEVCNVEENPFDLLVADHLTHFAPHTLAHAAARAGFDVLRVETAWVKKELSMLARRASPAGEMVEPADGRGVLATMAANVRWLGGLISKAREAATDCAAFGIFGTSIAGTWLGSVLADKVAFFVDEDPNRIGREFMGKPIVGPDAIPAGASVYLALAPVLAEAIGRRLSAANSQVRYVLPG